MPDTAELLRRIAKLERINAALIQRIDRLDAARSSVYSLSRATEVLEREVDEVRAEVNERSAAGARRVHTSTGDVDFDALVVATGSRPRSLAALDGIGGVHQLRSFDDALAVLPLAVAGNFNEAQKRLNTNS